MRLDTLQELLAGLREANVTQVTIRGRVSTVTSPGGEEVTFRGTVSAEADIGGGATIEYTEQVSPYTAVTDAPALPLDEEHQSELLRAKLLLQQQLRAYRGEYQGLMSAARRNLTERLQQAGVTVRESGEQQVG